MTNYRPSRALPGRWTGSPFADLARPTNLLRWKAEGEQFFAARALGARGIYKLTVEQLPDPGWEWMVWLSERVSRHGVAESATTAMAKAESGLSELDC